MYARVVTFYVLVSLMTLSKCVIVKEINVPGSISKSKTELSPLLISAGLNDIIVISTPMDDYNNLYYLNKPNGDVEVLNFNISRVNADNKLSRHDNSNYVRDNYVKEVKSIINPVNEYIILKLNDAQTCLETLHNFNHINHFMIGPLDESDHGNWILSFYYKGNDDEWVENFQVITIEIKETIPISPFKSRLHPGDDFYPRFAYPLQHLESCEIIPPRSTFDRFFDRDKRYHDSCGFHIPNITRADEGLWRIIGVGKIVYESNIFLQINGDVT